MSYNLNFPNIPEGPVEMQVAKLRSYLHQTIGQLNFILNNLNEEEAVESAAGLSAEEVSSLAKKAVRVHAEDKNNPDGVTAAQVGAAPAGYGLGLWSGHMGFTDANEMLCNGWYYCNNVANTPFANGWMFVTARDSGWVKQEFCSALHDTGPTLIRFKEVGVWGEWEWVNPPMVIGQEYRTTQRWEGKPVYQKATNFGALPNNSYASTGVSAADREKILSICGFIENESGESRPIPYATSHPGMKGTVDLFARTTGTATIAVVVSTDFDASGWTAVLILRYTKSTD